MWTATLFAVISATMGSTAPTLSDEAQRARIATVTQPTMDFSTAESYERYPGGATTVFKTLNRNSFSHPSANMSFERALEFHVGNGIFRKTWVSAPASTQSSDGLGPLFNARSCQRCHLKDGRGHPPSPGQRAESMILKLTISTGHPDRVYGGQLQNFAVQDALAEGEIEVSYEEIPVVLSDDEVVHLRQPTYDITRLAYGPLGPDTQSSPRIAPPMIGMGLLEAIPEADILAGADPDDRNEDGISGRPNRVWSDEHQRRMLGRFGWKAAQPTIVQQAATAFRNDIGIATPLRPEPWGDCTAAQSDCRTMPHGDTAATPRIEAGEEMMDRVAFYTRNLAVPARRDINDPQVLHGKRLFHGASCTACHRPKFVTRRDSIGIEQSFQLVWPYSDLLLHDMGEELADHRPEGEATGREWRTPPLWGIGLTELVSGHTQFLHDGRARNLLEAILWHGGEAQASRDQVVAMTRDERMALLAFLRSL